VRIVLAHSHANTFGGGERAVLETGRTLAEGHAVSLLLGGFDPRRTYPELATLPYSRLNRWQWPVARVAAEAIVTNSFGANLLALRNGPRVAYWVHSTRSVFLVARGAQARRVDLVVRRVLDWLAVRRAGQLVANSQYTASRLQALYHRSPDAVVYPGVDAREFYPAERPGAYAITVGRLASEKGLERVLDAWRDLPDVPLHIVGTGSADVLASLRARAPAGVVFRGALGTAAVAAAYRGAALAVFAPHGEEFGLAPLEAMASGLPVVAWREGGLQESVIDGESGYLVSDMVTFRQRVRLLVHDEARRSAMAVAARERAEGFSWRQTARELAAVCARLADPLPPAHAA
jgi:glycosyltransferase involved in cell wall biosynthesis